MNKHVRLNQALGILGIGADLGVGIGVGISVGALMASQITVAAVQGENTTTQVQSEAQRPAEATDGQSVQREFNEVDSNSDNLVTWQELQQAYDSQLTEVGLTEDQFIKDFDSNRDLALDEVEYRTFTTGVMDRQVYSATEINEQSPQKTLQDPEVAASDDQPSGQQALKPGSQLKYQQKQQQQKQQRQTERQVQKDGTIVAIVGVTAVQNVPVADVANRQVINLEGKKIGAVEEVVRSGDGATTGLVVSTGGFFGIGAKEVVIDVHNVHLTEDEVVWEETEEDAVDRLPKYNEKDYVSVR